MRKYYSLNEILKCDATYNIILGMKNNGKSYSVKEHVISNSWENDNEKFVLIRRLKSDNIASLATQYFDDIPIAKITHNKADGILVNSHKIYLTKYDETTDKIDKVKQIGYTVALDEDSRMTSIVFKDVSNIVYEEFISNDYYLRDEVNRLNKLVSTISRSRKVKVFLIGNTLSRICPYYKEWGLVNVPKQKQGTIEIYNYTTDQHDENGEIIKIKIAVELCDSIDTGNFMTFGNSSKMINSGAWESKEYPHLYKKLNDFNIVYSVIFKLVDFTFKGQLLTDDNGNALWYIEPFTKQISDNERVITDDMFYISTHPYATKFFGLSQAENQAFDIIKKENKVCFSDNLTGSDFYNCLMTK